MVGTGEGKTAATGMNESRAQGRKDTGDVQGTQDENPECGCVGEVLRSGGQERGHCRGRIKLHCRRSSVPRCEVGNLSWWQLGAQEARGAL